ncbi:hypothetical protein DVH24_019790 [Malus domestica]|uniref:Uncharacterized protein n=1 Tax=Malus domestica TaxID=3750 RepID=A0A498I3T9_MALDO|nr:hypothetical protein DVH24_019790 [Malus domestica]
MEAFLQFITVIYMHLIKNFEKTLCFCFTIAFTFSIILRKLGKNSEKAKTSFDTAFNSWHVLFFYFSFKKEIYYFGGLPRFFFLCFCCVFGTFTKHYRKYFLKAACT